MTEFIDLKDLENKIEHLRVKLHHLVAAKSENFTDEEVAKLSSELDELIVAYQHASGRKS